MAVKLFAFEENDVVEAETLVETTPEEGAVAEVEAEVVPEVTEIEEQSEAIDEGIEAADQLEEVQEVVEKAVEEGEGLTEPAVEAIRIAIEAISARIGYDPKKMTGLRAVYASESFATPSSRLANTKIALEGIGSFLSKLWEKIKQAFRSLIEKAKNFWDTYVSGVEKTVRSLESVKEKFSSRKDTPKISETVDVPDSFRTFNVKSLSSASFNSFKNLTTGLNAYIESALDEVNSKVANIGTEGYVKGLSNNMLNFTAEYLPGGNKFSLKTTSVDTSEESFDVVIEKSVVVDLIKPEKVQILTASEIKEIINNAIDVLNESKELKKTSQKLYDSIDKAIKEAEKNLFDSEKGTKKDASSEEKKKIKTGMTNSYKLINSLISASAKSASINVVYGKLVIKYVEFCLKFFDKK